MSELIEKLAETVEGAKKNRDVTILTLSTCMWCKKCKVWLKDRDVQYKFVEVDKIDFKEKSKVLDYLRDKYQSRISYPFMICDDEFVVGYNPNRYEDFLKEGGN